MYLPRASSLLEAACDFGASAAYAAQVMRHATANETMGRAKRVIAAPWIISKAAILSQPKRHARSRAAQVPGLGPCESLYAIGRQREPDAGMTDARPGQPGTNAVAAVPVHRARPYFGQDPARALFVRRVDPRGEAVFAVVHHQHRFGVVPDLLDADDRPEALVAHQAHPMVDVGHYRRLEPVAVALDDLAAGQQGRAAPLRIGHLLLQNFQLRAARDRSDVGLVIERIADPVAFDLGDKGVDESVVDLLVDVDALDRAARLSGVVERAVGDPRRR